MADGKRKGAPSGKDGQQSKKKRVGLVEWSDGSPLARLVTHVASWLWRLREPVQNGMEVKNLSLTHSQTGNAGKWKTPHQQTKMAQHAEATVQPGDEGIWVTCARHQEGKAAREVGVLFSEVC